MNFHIVTCIQNPYLVNYITIIYLFINMAFTAKYGDGSSKDDIGSNDEVSAKLREAGFKSKLDDN